MFSLAYKNHYVSFEPSKHDDYIKKAHKTGVDNRGNLYSKREYQYGKDVRHFLFEFEFLDRESKEILETIYLIEPSVNEPAKLNYEGKEYDVIFSPELNDSACKFSAPVRCESDNKMYYPGQIGLRKIKEEA